ncbi:hypothetical protein FNF29_08375 [Cafeteria roenbergensis]|uniref:Beta-lactamase n=1 Tax=Cafeteria roenbergensis TaxID=33653 RepID=A0A5A8DCC8_CAFRO|nr:hypothetical protein FNF29_08375 [Cafeteria roenbergensis]KAA0162935.1 hypothetical protein FNF28_04491 [Cafeteria roenbergensis]CAE7945712.1 Coa7 [Symbiodinium sp. KB8]|eukprot:KAA0145822.1 hypothetical protein FNF29_08375 [Cafeteria roenbergensis]
MMTPARRKRDLAKSDAEQRRIDEEKYVGFSVACNNDEANACHSLGEWYAVLRANFSKAAELYRPNCLERGYANSCFNLGLLFGAGKGVQKDRTAALELFERGCELGNGDACDLAGRSLLEAAARAESADSPAEGAAKPDATRGGGIVKTGSAGSAALKAGDAAAMRAHADKLLQRGCVDLENATACKFLGEVLLVGRFGHPMDKPRAAELLETACDRFEMTACRNLMLMHVRGDGVPKDFAKAEEFRQRSVAAVEQESGVRMPEYLQERFRKNHGPEARS